MLGFHALGEQALGATVDTALVDYTIAASVGSFTLTGQAAGVPAARKITAAAGSFALTGNAAGLSVAMPAEVGSFALTGQAAGLSVARTLPLGTGAFTLAGQAAGVTAARLLQLGAGSFALTGQDSTLNKGFTLTAGVGSFALTGQAANVLVGYVLKASRLPPRSENWTLFGPLGVIALGQSDGGTSATTFSLTGNNAFVGATRLITAQPGSFAFTGNSAGLAVSMPADVGAFVISGQAAGTLATRIINCEVGEFVVSTSNVLHFRQRRLLRGKTGGSQGFGGKAGGSTGFGGRSGGGTRWKVAC